MPAKVILTSKNSTTMRFLQVSGTCTFAWQSNMEISCKSKRKQCETWTCSHMQTFIFTCDNLTQLWRSSKLCYFPTKKAILNSSPISKVPHRHLSCSLSCLIAKDLFVPARAHAWHRVTFYSRPLLTCAGRILSAPGLMADNSVSVFHISCSSSLCQKNSEVIFGWLRAVR